MPYELKTMEVEVCGEKLIVSQASNLMDVERAMKISDADTNNGHHTEGSEDSYRRYLESLLFPSLVSCTTGNLPTLEQFLHSVPATETEKWIAAARELNPQWFRFIAESDTPEALEKKDQ